MKYTPSAFVSMFSGKQGSTVASHNRFGPYFRNRVIPVNANTSSQVNARNNLKAIAIAWRGLTDAQRNAWRGAAASITLIDRLGRPYNPSGFQYFMSVNRTTYVYSGSATITTATPTAAAPAAPLTMTATPDSGLTTFAITFTATPVPALTKMIIEATRQLSPGVGFIRPTLYRQLMIVAPAATSPQALYTAYVAKYGLLTAGKKIAVRLTNITSDGQRSASLSVLSTVN